MEIARQWLEVQRATPSFAGGDASIMPVNDSILNGPYPAGLESFDPEGNHNNNNNNTFNSSRYNPSSYNNNVSRRSASANNANNYGVPVHDQLLAKGKLYQQRREAMKERTVSDQLRHMRNPRLSEEAKKLKREEKIEERFRRLQQQKDEKRYYEETLRQQEDEKVFSRAFKPTITNRARQASARISSSRSAGGAGSGDALEQQMRRREEKASQIRLKYMMQDMSEVRDVPSINPVSEKLAARRREKEGLGGMSHIEAMIERDRSRRAEMWEKQREKEEEESAHPYPKITLYAANLQREGDAADRLYQESLETEARRVERIQSKLDETRKQASHTPRITALAAQVGRNGGNNGEPIEDELMRRHLDAMSHREELIRQQVERERDRRNPAINPVSDSIASRLPQTARERLLLPKAQYVDANEPNFQPRINNNGRGRSGSQQQNDDNQQQFNDDGRGSGGGGGGQWEEARSQQIEQYQNRKAEKIRQLKEEAERRELAECTFQPSIHSNPNHQDGNNNNNNNSYYDTDNMNIVDRSTQWLKRREAKLQAQRNQQLQQQNQQEQQQGSNSPHRSNQQQQQNNYSSSSARAGGGGGGYNSQQQQNQNVAGVDSFVDRLEEGRRRRHEQYTKLYATGSKWTGESTTQQQQQNDDNTYGGGSSNYYNKSESRERSYGNNTARGGSTSGGNNNDVRSLRPPLQERVSLSILSP